MAGRKKRAGDLGADIGIQLLVSVAIGAAIGYGADRVFDTSPWGLLIGVGLGFAAWLRMAWQVLNIKH